MGCSSSAPEATAQGASTQSPAENGQAAQHGAPDAMKQKPQKQSTAVPEQQQLGSGVPNTARGMPPTPTPAEPSATNNGPIVTPVTYEHNSNPNNQKVYKGWAPPTKVKEESKVKAVGKTTEDITDEWDADGNLKRTIVRTTIDKTDKWKWHKEREVIEIPAAEAQQYR